jgi:hypothetical protein
MITAAMLAATKKSDVARSLGIQEKNACHDKDEKGHIQRSPCVPNVVTKIV